jgi:hypothetical protein
MGISKAKMDQLRNDFGGVCKKYNRKNDLQFAMFCLQNYMEK